MVSILPKEETIIDPLYEPLKLNRYELCDHLTMLSNVSHLRYGFSPYLLFDVEGWKEVVGVIIRTRTGEEIDCTAFINGLEKYLGELERLPGVENTARNGLYADLKNGRDEIKEKHKNIKSAYQEILNKFLNDSNKFKENFGKIAHLFRLDYPVKVECPKREEEQVTEQFMCEEGKIYSMKEALLRTFELRRAKWLQMSGSLHTVHRAATHTRLSHEIGSMIAGVNALREIDVYPRGNISMSLGEYLLMRGELHEFLMANFLHDIGHSPLSHVMEPNPFLKLDHEEVTRNLIRGEKVEGDGEGKIDWYVAERYLLKMKAIKNLEYRFFENRYDSIYDVGGDKQKRNFLDCLKENGEILESEVVTVSEVLANFGVDKDRVVEILSGKIFCPGGCGRLLKIEDGKVEKCGTCGEAEIEREKIYDTQFLNKLVESEIDIDRMDHVKRDSVVCGLSLSSFRLLELLGSMSVVLPDSDACTEIDNQKSNGPYISVSEDGILYVMDLLTARRAVFKDVLHSDENNWINGVVNQITALAVRYLPHLTNMLPFITDQILMHFYMNDMFLGTQIEKLNKLFYGKIGYCGYGKPMRYKLIEGAIVTEVNLRDMYRKIERINDSYDRMEMPAVVFYTNIKPTKCPICRERELRMVNDSYECANCRSKITETFMTREGIYEYENNKKVYMELEIAINKENTGIYSAKNRMLDAYEIIGDIENEGTIYKVEPKPKMEKWDDIFIYGKKFGNEYYSFQKLAEKKYEGITRERFPEMPSELDVKNLFYFWISDFFAIKEGCKNTVKEEIGTVWAGAIEQEETPEHYNSRKIKEFGDRFVDLDDVQEEV